jgi:hypothetical protein
MDPRPVSAPRASQDSKANPAAASPKGRGTSLGFRACLAPRRASPGPGQAGRLPGGGLAGQDPSAEALLSTARSSPGRAPPRGTPTEEYARPGANEGAHADDEREREDDEDRDLAAVTTEFTADGDIARPPCLPGTFGVSPFVTVTSEPHTAASALANRPPEELVPMLVRSAAVGGDRDNAAMHMVLGGTELSGGTLSVRAHRGRVAVSLRVPASSSAAHWEEKIRDRLADKGLTIADLDVR